MSADEQVTTLLRRAAESVEVPPEMPARLRRKVRRRQGVTVGAGLLSVAAVVTVALFIPREASQEPVGVGGKHQIASGRLNGEAWVMELQGQNDGTVCIRAAGRPSCWDLTQDMYGEAGVALGYVRDLDAAVVIVRCPPGCGMWFREIDGAFWAGMAATEGDEWSISYRFFEGGNVRGILTVDGADAPILDVYVTANWPNVKTGISITDTEFPELRGFRGEKRIVGTIPDLGGHTVIVSENESEVCLHIGDVYRCRDAADAGHRIRLWVTRSYPCDEFCGPGQVAVVIAGEVGSEIEEIVIEGATGGGLQVRVEQPYTGFFSTVAYLDPGASLHLTGLNSVGTQVDSVPIWLPEGS